VPSDPGDVPRHRDRDHHRPAACGDLVEAVCCTATAACKGAFDGATPVDFACCGKAGGTRPPVCLNGWKTCADGAFAILPGAGCK